MELFANIHIIPYICKRLDKQSAESSVKSVRLDKTQFTLGDANIVYLRWISKLFVENIVKIW